MSMDLFEDRIHVASLIRVLEAAWNRFDAKSYAACFAEDADFVHKDGERASGRAAIEAAHQQMFDTIYKGSVIAYRIDAIDRAGVQTLSIGLFQSLRYSADNGWAVLHGRPTLMIGSDRGLWRLTSMETGKRALSTSPA
jgi:ketosteroid isomerase-like protein